MEMPMKSSIAALVIMVGTGVGLAQPAHAQQPFNVLEATIPQIRAAQQSGVLTAEELTRAYLARIAAYDDAGPRLNAYLSVNADAIRQAQMLDAQGPQPNRPLWGIPVLLKDNIDTADMPTTAGSVALRGSLPPNDAFITLKLRQAGAIILGKATLSEFANFISSTQQNGFSSLGGAGRNPYGGDTGGSSSGSGIGVAANLAAVAVGTETSGSILSPSSSNGVVGIKPTLGLISRDGIIPIAEEQDTAGPMARTVTDAAILLGVLAGRDPADPRTNACQTAGNCFSNYTQFLDENALVGARIGVLPSNNAALQSAVAVLRREGATVVNVAAYAQQPANSGFLLRYAFKRDLNRYLAATPGAPRRTLAQIITFNNTVNPPLRFGQDILVSANALNITAGSADSQRFATLRAQDTQRARTSLNQRFNGPDGQAGTADDFDALLHFSNGNAQFGANAGFPSVSVPGAFTGGRPGGGIVFAGRAFSEPQLIALAFAYEQATLNRRPPATAPALATDIIR
jgi:amidase